MNAAVFLDRDGTINVDPGYVGDPTRVKLFPGVPEALGQLQSIGFKLIIITNQSGIGRGIITPEGLTAVNARIFELAGVQPDRIYMCFHHPTEAVGEYRIACACRKPGTGLIEQGVRELGLDLNASFIVGDAAVDLEAGRNAGLTRVLVRTGRGEATLAEVRSGRVPAPEHVAQDLADAAQWIMTRGGNLRRAGRS